MSGVADLVLKAVEVAIKYLPIVVKTANDLEPFAVALWQKYTNKEPTEPERADLVKRTQDLYARLQEPLPPAQPGDPDYKP